MSAGVFQLDERARGLAPGVAPSLLRGLGPFVACVVIAALLQMFVKPMLGAYSAKLVLDIGVNIILAVSLTMVNGFTGQFSMGHAGFMAVGGYTAGVVSYYGSLKVFGSAAAVGGVLSGMPIRAPEGVALLSQGDLLFVCSLLVGGLVSALLGFLVGLPSLRLRGDYLAIVTLGFGEIVRVMITQTGPVLAPMKLAAPNHPLTGQMVVNLAGGSSEPRYAAVGDVPWTSAITGMGGALGFSGLPTYTSLFWVFLFAFVTLLVAYRLKKGTFGRAFLSIREDEIASEAMGVNTTRYKVWAFVIAAFFAGIAGGLFAHTLGVGLSPQAAGFQKSFDIIIMVVLGGLGSISGATIAAVVVTLLPEYLRPVAEYRMIIFALSLILMMIFRPQGLLGVRELWDKALWRDARSFFTRRKAVPRG
ncbi:MAG TPA: branched-chain amino acid ABC transporter permease [Phycisphaerales bacterium]|nr:branched-chain amino acid ABC transporter permease [Phycisphaerales bacterium]